ncbi:Ppx/GppA phosphatase family protein [Demetria terragena]|uniref:Ppx/GppA phosphatase family protein n=1 Tax=Demetria terragena TaxID=63959 RepID=UPI000375FD85|nr:Ppx/GppA phosphatase family protein [Demetria terragena]
MTRVAAIDCGTNSIRLLIADRDGSGGLVDVIRRTEVVRLGQGVDVTGRISPEAMERTLARAREYAALCREHQVEAARFVATSASRDADNAEEFVAGVRAAFGDLDVSPEVVSGAEEASLSFAGATGDLVAAGTPAPYLVVDLGGGSTELVRGSTGVEQQRSVDIGCVRMTERHLRSDPPTAEEISAATRDVDAALDLAEQDVDLAGIATLVGLAGSVTTITAHALDLSTYDPEAIHGARLEVDQVIDSCTALLSATRAQRSAMPFMHPGRVDVIGAGALVWRRVVERVAASAGVTATVTSETDILDGIALSCPP